MVGPTLRVLRLRGCEHVGDGLPLLLTAALEELDVAFTALGDEGLARLARLAAGGGPGSFRSGGQGTAQGGGLGRAPAPAAPALRRLTLARQDAFNLWETWRWTEQGLAAFRAAAPHVSVSLVSC